LLVADTRRTHDAGSKPIFIGVGDPLKHPLRHALLLLAMMLTVVSFGAAFGAWIGYLLRGEGIVHFIAECTLWLIGIGLIASPLASKGLRERLIAAIPR
jgi:hypothetical protein